MKPLVAFFAGVVFSVGLVISGMTQPAKVVGFLDFLGNWDPSLAFVMGGAVLVNALLFRLTLRRERPLLATTFHLPSRQDLDWRLIGGGVLFGVGWGLAGYCPGPALTSVATGGSTALTFVAAMVGGILLHELFTRRLAPVSTADDEEGSLVGERIEPASGE